MDPCREQHVQGSDVLNQMQKGTSGPDAVHVGACADEQLRSPRTSVQTRVVECGPASCVFHQRIRPSPEQQGDGSRLPVCDRRVVQEWPAFPIQTVDRHAEIQHPLQQVVHVGHVAATLMKCRIRQQDMRRIPALVVMQTGIGSMIKQAFHARVAGHLAACRGVQGRAQPGTG
jgi:hypothetical protein